MSFETLRRDVENYFNNNWTATSLTSIDYGNNESFDPVGKTAWARLTINPSITNNAEVGTGLQRTTGFITVQCFVPSKTGEAVINQLVDNAVSIFQNVNFGGVRCLACTPINIPVNPDDANWFQKNARTRFTYDVFS